MKQTYQVSGMHCAACANTIQKTISKIDGVEKCNVNFAAEKVNIETIKEVPLDKLNEKISLYGYNLKTPDSEENSTSSQMHDHTKNKESDLTDMKDKVYLTFPITLTVFGVMLLSIANTFSKIPILPLPMDLIDKLFLIIAGFFLFYIGFGFLKEIIIFIQYRVANMYTLVGIGTLTAFIYSLFIVLFPDITEEIGLPMHSYSDVTIVVIGFVFLGKYLEEKSKYQTGEALKKLMALQVKTALVEIDGKEEEIQVDEIKIKNILLVKPGTKIALDGEIIFGETTIDESMITGESLPVDKKNGDKVIGGTINKQGFIKVVVTKTVKEGMLSQIIKLVEEAQGTKAPVEKLADKVSSIFVPTVLVIALITLAAWLFIGPQYIDSNASISFAISAFVGVLVIACPCSLGLATPTAMIVGIGKAALNGILVKDSESLEKLSKVDTLVVDKTGTLTLGEMAVVDVENIVEDNNTLDVLLSIESKSEHPIATAISNYAKSKNAKELSVYKFKNIEGNGVSAEIDDNQYLIVNLETLKKKQISFDNTKIDPYLKEGKTLAFLVMNNKLIAYITLSDTIRNDVRSSITNIKKLGIKVMMLTGDHFDAAKNIADKVGISEFKSSLMPADKLDIIKNLQKGGAKIAMVGDGINDAPALALADVGIAMGTGTDIAISSANITLLKGDFSKVYSAIKISKATLTTVKQNLFWAFFYNVVGIPLAAGIFYPVWGLTLNPAFAGLAMGISSVSVVSNSLRLKLTKI